MLNLENIFSRKKSQRKVAKFLLRKGIRVSGDKKLFFGGIGVSNTAVARVLELDRRVVSATVDAILKEPDLKKIFGKLNCTLLLGEVAPELGFGAIEIIPTDAASKGIIADVTRIIADANISVRQIITDDPMFENAEMTVVTEKPIPRELIDRILELSGVKKVIVLS
ncbi:MAG: amino acid-binding protein [Candidatus Altiarchaeota archaeon]|nr:amino acid-binding protein [Candidatus Altiarchaeota archaeon]